MMAKEFPFNCKILSSRVNQLNLSVNDGARPDQAQEVQGVRSRAGVWPFADKRQLRRLRAQLALLALLYIGIGLFGQSFRGLAAMNEARSKERSLEVETATVRS